MIDWEKSPEFKNWRKALFELCNAALDLACKKAALDDNPKIVKGNQFGRDLAETSLASVLFILAHLRDTTIKTKVIDDPKLKKALIGMAEELMKKTAKLEKGIEKDKNYIA